MAALSEFGFPSRSLMREDFANAGAIIQLGLAPNRIDILMSLTGIGWSDALATSVAGNLAGVPVRFLGRDALIRNKTATGRLQDQADVEALRGRDHDPE